MPSTKTICQLLSIALLILAAADVARANPIPDGLAREPRPASWKADASLTDVVFLDRQRGWAVGSQGVLLRTENGGKTWGEGNLTSTSSKTKEFALNEKVQRIRANQQIGAATTTASPFSCRFETVCFTDAKNGWAAGGYDLPYLDHSRAVIARTNDGGKSWQSLPHLMLGRIQKIEFRGMQRLSGWAIGTSDPATDSALHFTSDAGNIWHSQKSKRMPNLVDAENAGQRFAGIDANGQPVNFDSAKFEYSVITDEGNFFLTDIAMADAKTGWAVGSDGAILTTNNGGLSWSIAKLNMPELSEFDFRCVHLSENKIWFAGDPGNVLFSVDRKSGQWDSHALPAGAAINRICFVDAQFGWAVGDLGKIWATQDGGENWKLQRSGSQRGKSQVGVLAFCKDESELPIEFIARHAGEDGKLFGVVMPRSRNNDAMRLATERIGAAVVSPIDANSEDDLLRKTVRTIRLWRPTIVAGTSTPMMEKAIRLAANEQAYPRQLSSGLKAWQTQFLMVRDPNGPLQFENSVFLTRISALLEDFVLPSRMICRLPIVADEPTAFFAWKYVGNGPQVSRKEVTQSPFSQTQILKRKLDSIPLGNLAAVGKLSKKNELMQALLNQRIDSVLDVEQCKRSINEFVYWLNSDPNGHHLAGVWLIQLADQYVAAGQPQRAAWALESLAKGYPTHCLAPLASKTLANYYSSTELNQLAINQWQKLRLNIGQANRIPAGAKRGPQNVAIQQSKQAGGRTEYRWDKVDLASALEEASELALDIDVEEELKDFDPATVDLSLESTEPEVDSLTHTQTAVAPMTSIEIEMFLKERHRIAANHFSRIGGRDPGLVKQSQFQFLQAHIVKQLGGLDEAKPYFQNVLKAKPHAEFSPAARDELRTSNEGITTKAVLTSQRPHLDGLPNDAVWQEVMKDRQTIKVAKLNGALMDDIAMVARDDEFVYIYARCYRSNRFQYESRTEKIRQRDADMTNRDRIEISFDVDRDLVSSWNLQVDWQGQVHESCGGDISWNPKMYVANHVDDSVWSIECAIPIKDLAAKFKTGDAWRLNIRRQQDENQSRAAFWGTDFQAAGQLLQF